MPTTAERLAATLRGLVVVVEAVTIAHARVAVPSYPDGPRPSSVVTLAGRGASGRGEHVGWTAAEHAAFAALAEHVPHGTHRLGAWCAAAAAITSRAYDRAALEAAAIDLALRQAGASLFDVAGCAPRPVRYVVSFGRLDEPVAAAAIEPEVELKLDADAAWSDDTLAALAALGRVAVVDWKTTGAAADHARVARQLPDALIEDPGPADGTWARAPFATRVAADGWLASPADLARLPSPPGAVNVKPGRMGGVFPALALAAAAETAGVPAYVGGMFEVGPGRDQIRALAALLSPDGPNDVAPIATSSDTIPQRPARLTVRADRPGLADDTRPNGIL